MMIQQPLGVANRGGQYDVICRVSGGGLSGQAGAVRHGLSKALTYFEPELRSVLKHGGFLTRDSRVAGRKKNGKGKARRQFQFSKRLLVLSDGCEKAGARRPRFFARGPRRSCSGRKSGWSDRCLIA